ncbi:transglycosylase domain-containing protein [Leptolinea tardivitalis]|uniref:transglycosylase domain-containing protein n=1 Tax=Leptolinea tardivitalis TaxID=229920 RepID=UPI0007847B64|nr:transglycosylase domain-containing protein [Leptolinea tardivitalis]GAP21209.1 membrane carboxypeptidase [Leptolinea tardivitalis]
MAYFDSFYNSSEDTSDSENPSLPDGGEEPENESPQSQPQEIKPDFPLEDRDEDSEKNKQGHKKPPYPLNNHDDFLLNDTGEQRAFSENRFTTTGGTVVPKRHAPPYATQPFFQPQITGATKVASQPLPTEGKTRSDGVTTTGTVQTNTNAGKNRTQVISTPAGGSKPPAKYKNKTPGKDTGCFVKALIIILIVGLAAVFIMGAAAIYQYFSLASSLPGIENLSEKTSQFETTRIMDRNGDLLYELLSPTAGRRTYVPLEKISPYLIAATIATEDKDYYNHPGFDPYAIFRALVQNYTSGETVSGASTITQQLARMLLFSQEERVEVSLRRKAREIVLAAEITRKYSKEQILEMYLNEAYYSNMAYGIEAAAETYFNTTADKLTLSQASFLAGLPQSPGVYDIFTNREDTLRRQVQVLDLMVQLSNERNCIYVSTNVQPVCIDANSAATAAVETSDYPFEIRQNNMRFPHWVNYIRSQLEQQYDPQTIYRSGFTVYTTIDPTMQEMAERIVKEQVDTLADYNVSDGALVAIQPSTGQILSMVGSADFNNVEISGQVNMAVSPRQPGSSIKPLTYTAAFEKGWTPATIIWDVPSEFPPSGDPNDPREPYKPINYDEKFHGPVTVRTALANSYNIPAVKTLQYIGIYDNKDTPEPDGFINFAKRMGINTLTRDDYGLSLTLGGGEVTLLDMTSAFAIYANQGMRVKPVSILKIEDYSGNLIYQYKPEEPEQVIRPEHAYLITSILSDNKARAPMFGENSVLRMPFDAAAKTGTTNNYRDNWTMGYTPDLAVGVWVGNADYSPMQNTTGVTGAAPIWSAFMKEAAPYISHDNPTPFKRPGGIIDKVICTISGTEPSEDCPETRSEIFASDQLPLPKNKDFYSKVTIDTWTGYLASGECQEFQKAVRALSIDDKWGKDWLSNTDEGREWLKKAGLSKNVRFAPERQCKASDPKPTIFFPGLEDGQTITESPFDIYAVADVPSGFKEFYLEYGIGEDPGDWIKLAGPFDSTRPTPDRIVTWDVSELTGNIVTVRLVMVGQDENYAEKRIHLILNVPPPTPMPTATPTITPEPSLTPTNTEVPPQPTGTVEPITTTPENSVS